MAIKSMRRTLSMVLTFVVALAPYPAMAQVREQTTPVPVVVELFTSEGCSDCPPADTLLSALSHSSPAPDTKVIALGEHVDYWNHGGWADPYSGRGFSMRQGSYADHFGIGEVYTPQMIVDGSAQFVGSDGNLAAQAIIRAARAAKVNVHITSLRTGTSGVTFQVDVGGLSAEARSGNVVDIFVAVTEDNLTSHVLGGENGGRTLRHVAVVRELRVVGIASISGTTKEVELPLAAHWRRESLNVVAFVQDRASRRILGAVEESVNGGNNG